MNIFKSKSICLFASLLLIACGDDSNSSEARVVRSSIEDRIIRVGESTVVKFGIVLDGFSGGFFGNSEDIAFVVKLPRGVRFRENSAEIQGTIDDEKVRPEIISCSNGDTFLDFNLDDDDISDGTSSSSSADFDLNLTVDGVIAGEIGVIAAKADEDSVLYSCNGIFINDVEETIQVVS